MLTVTLLVKEGDGALEQVRSRLNAWFTEGPHDPPFPPGTLLYYWAKDLEPVVGTPSRASCGHPANGDGECGCSYWPEKAPAV